MFAVYAAEQQYRHDTLMRDREQGLLVSMRERKTAVARRRPAPAAARPVRTAWARPIGVHVADGAPTACATA